MEVFVKYAGIMGYIDLNTCICGSTRIYAGIVATLLMGHSLCEDMMASVGQALLNNFSASWGNE